MLSRRHARTSQACRQNICAVRRRARPEKGRPRLPGRRLRLHFPRLSRAAAAHPQVGRAAGQCRARLLQHAVEAAARHEAGGTPTHLAVVFDKSEKTFRSEMYPDYKAHRPDAAGRSHSAVPAYPRRGARLRPAVPGAGRLRGRRSDRHLCAAGLRGRRDRHHRVVRQGPDAARERLRHHVRHHEGQAASASPR